jgi:HPt (histidine-containing phosphotransfer) domain-containing protein
MSYPPEDKKLINFNALSAFASDNMEFSRQLIAAFLSDLLIFEEHIKDALTEEEFLSFRKAYHSISPSLQMLEISDLIKAVEDFKISFTENPASLSAIADNIRHLLQLVKEETRQWQAA